jgi:FlaA1/EpsC-like NDP-sugar epimerase
MTIPEAYQFGTSGWYDGGKEVFVFDMGENR